MLIAELFELRPYHRCIVLFHHEIPGMCCSLEVIGGEPHFVIHERALASEIMLVVVQPFEGILLPIKCRKLHLVVSRSSYVKKLQGGMGWDVV